VDKTSEAYAKKLLAEMGNIKTAIAGIVLPRHAQTKQADPQNDSLTDGENQAHTNPLWNPITPDGKPSELKSKKTHKGKGEGFREFFATHKPTLEQIGLVVLIGYTTIAALQWRTSVDVATKQLRAFLYVEKVELVAGNSEGLSLVNITIHNGGPTAARKGFIRRYVVEFDPAPNVAQPFTTHPLRTAQADEPLGLVPPQSQVIEVQPLQPDLVEAMRTKKISFAIKGDIEYVDIFGKPHVTQFCQQSRLLAETPGQPPEFSFGACEKHNCDDDDCQAD
jgi:hypothetical protein